MFRFEVIQELKPNNELLEIIKTMITQLRLVKLSINIMRGKCRYGRTKNIS